MKNESIFHPQSEIKISVLKIDNKRLTKSLLDQIETQWPFDDQLNLTAEKVFGFVKIKKKDAPSFHHIVVAEKDGKLLKFNTERLMSLSRIQGETPYGFLHNNYRRLLTSLFGDNVLDSLDLEEDVPLRISDLPEDQIREISGIIEKVDKFLNELKNHHIFI